jgi:uncharacterized protein YbaR (Trm112 family)
MLEKYLPNLVCPVTRSAQATTTETFELICLDKRSAFAQSI